MKFVTVTALLLAFLSTEVHAQIDERGFFFKLGEKILNFAGYSYLEMEKKLASSDKNLSECLTDVAQAKFKADKKDQELKVCKGEAPATETPATDTAAPAAETAPAAPAAAAPKSP
jgi:hypothetical protein